MSFNTNVASVLLISEEAHVSCDTVPWWGRQTNARVFTVDGDDALPTMRAGDVVVLDLDASDTRLREILQDLDQMASADRPTVYIAAADLNDPALRIAARTFGASVRTREDIARALPRRQPAGVRNVLRFLPRQHSA